MLASDEQRAWYGPDHVALAVDRGAVGTLLISDELFRAGDPVVRKRYVSLVEDVREKRGEVLIFSSMHESGQRRYHTIDEAHLLIIPLAHRAQSNYWHCCHPDFSTGHRSRRSRRKRSQRRRGKAKGRRKR
jgi:eRF1 domain 3